MPVEQSKWLGQNHVSGRMPAAVAGFSFLDLGLQAEPSGPIYVIRSVVWTNGATVAAGSLYLHVSRGQLTNSAAYPQPNINVAASEFTAANQSANLLGIDVVIPEGYWLGASSPDLMDAHITVFVDVYQRNSGAMKI